MLLTTDCVQQQRIILPGRRLAILEETFIAAWEERKKMTLDGAVSYALKEY